MCGICGVLSLDGVRPDLTPVRRMADCLVHRGPDGDGFYSDTAIALGPVSYTHLTLPTNREV